MNTIIYGLVDPRTQLVRYVGKSTSGLTRPRAHRSASGRAAATHSANWIRQLKSLGLDYEIVVLDQGSATELPALERWWISYGRASGWPLTNLTDGGEGSVGATQSAETRARISAANRGRKRTPEFRARMSVIAKSRSPETLAKIGAASAALPAETRARIGMQLRGRKASPELRAKLSAAHMGHVVSEETRRKIAESNRRTKALKRMQENA